jgi:hypothetical protein
VLAEQAVDDREHLRARAHPAGWVEPDLEVRAGRDPDDAVADLGDLLPCGHLLADVHEVWPGVAVVDLEALQRTGRDLQDRGVGAKPGDPLADDHAVAHGVLGRAAGSGVVDTLVDVAVCDVLPRQRQRDAVRQHVRRGLWVDDGFGGATTAIDCELKDGFVALPEEPEGAGPPGPPAEEPPAELPPLELPLLPPRLDVSELPVPEEALVPVVSEPAPADPAPVEVSPRHAPAVCVPAVWLPVPPVALASVPALPVDAAAGVADAPAEAEVKASAACVTICAVAVPAVPPAVAGPASEFPLAGTLEMDVLVAAPDPPAPAPDPAWFAAFMTITGALNMLAHVRTSTAPVASRLCWR